LAYWKFYSLQYPFKPQQPAPLVGDLSIAVAYQAVRNPFITIDKTRGMRATLERFEALIVHANLSGT
jgi:hypothetical protein